MQFSEGEVRFLIGEHYAAGGQRELLPRMVDFRQLGCPERIFFAALERRARRLGRKFDEFRSRAAHCPNCAPPHDDAASQVEGVKLF